MTPEDRSPGGWDPWDGAGGESTRARPPAGDQSSGSAPTEAQDDGRLQVPQQGEVADVAGLGDLGAQRPGASAVTLDELVGDAPGDRRRGPREAARPRPDPGSGELSSAVQPDPAPGSLGKRSGASGKSGSGSFGKRSGGSGFGRGGSGSFGKRSGGSGFGDGGSGSFGKRGHRSGKRAAGASWGIQLDAEVEEPVPGPGSAPTGAADDSAAAPDGTAATGRPRAPGGARGRAGSFDRPRRAEGEPPAMDDPEQVARQLCLTALTGAAKTRQQLVDLLAARDVPAEAAEAVLDRFVEVGLVDDAAYAAAWVSSRQSGRGLSKRALSQELRAKGVDPEVAAVALEAVDPQDEWDTARALVAKKLPAMRRLDTVTATRRLVGMLARKGYGGGLAAIVVREALDTDGAAEDATAEADDAPPELAAAPDAPASAPEPTVRHGLWSGRPLDEPAESEVGEGLTLDAVARRRSFGRR